MARLRDQPPPPPPTSRATPASALTWRDFFDPDEPVPFDLAKDCHPREPAAEAFAWRQTRAIRRLRAAQDGLPDPYASDTVAAPTKESRTR